MLSSQLEPDLELKQAEVGRDDETRGGPQQGQRRRKGAGNICHGGRDRHQPLPSHEQETSQQSSLDDVQTPHMIDCKAAKVKLSLR